MGKGAIIFGQLPITVGVTVSFDTRNDKDIVVYSPSNPLSWDTITNKPTTLAGYGITDAMTYPQSDILYWDGDEYTPYVNKTAVGSNTYLYLGTTSPDGTGRLNLNGYLYTTRLYSNYISTTLDSISGVLRVNGSSTSSFTLLANNNEFFYAIAETGTNSLFIELGPSSKIRIYTDTDDTSIVVMDGSGSSMVFGVDGKDGLISFGCDNEILRGEYTYYRQTLGANTVGDWRTYCNGTAFYVDYLSSITPITWTNKHTIAI